MFYLILIALNVLALTGVAKSLLGPALFYKAILALSALDLIGLLLLLRKAGMLLLKLVLGLALIGTLVAAYFYLR